MKKEIIAINDNGTVIVPKNVRMTISEIAELFEIYSQTTKRYIRSIEKEGIVDGDYSLSCTTEGLKVYPDYYGLDMIIAVAFRVQSEKAEIFHKWVCRRVTQSSMHPVLTLLTNNSVLN